MINLPNQSIVSLLIDKIQEEAECLLMYHQPTLLSTIIHKKHLGHFMAKSMNELAQS